MGNLVLLGVLLLGGILIGWKISTDRKIRQETDEEFLFRKLKSAQRLQKAFIALFVLGGLLMLVLGFSDPAKFWWMLLLGLAGIAGGGFIIRSGVKQAVHPVVAAFERDPASLTGLKFTGFRFAGMKASEMANINVGNSVLSVYLADAFEKHRFLDIMHQRVPALVPQAPTGLRPAKVSQSGFRSLRGIFYVLIVFGLMITLRLWLDGRADQANGGTHVERMSRAERNTFETALDLYILDQNGLLPAMQDQNTRWDSVSLKSGFFYYNFTVVNLGNATFDKDMFKQAVVPTLIAQTCQDERRRNLINKDYPVVFAYHDEAGKRLATVTVEIEACKGL